MYVEKFYVRLQLFCWLQNLCDTKRFEMHSVDTFLEKCKKEIRIITKYLKKYKISKAQS